MRILMIILSVVFTLHLSATIINIPIDQPTIQEGINVSVDGDTVLVQPGEYQEMINFNGKSIIVGSLFLTTADSTFIESTVIHYGTNYPYVVRFENGENNNAIITGFKLGQNSLNTKGILCTNSSPQIISNLIAVRGSYGIRCEYFAMPLISNNIFENAARGVQISDNASPIITNNFFNGLNKAIMVGSGSAIIKENIIIGESTNLARAIEVWDVSSALRYTDLTLITDNGIIPIEAKTGETESKRDRVQAEKTDNILTYLTNDYSDNLFDDYQIIKRVATVNPEKNYIAEFNSLLSSAYKKGADLIKFEDGFTCIASYESNDPELMEQAIIGQGLLKPITFYLNINKFAGKGYYPFSLLFNEPKFYYDFLVGELNIIFFLDFRIIEKIADKNGYVVKKMSDDSIYLSFSKIEKNSSINEYIMSDHYFFRSFMELVSIEWLIQDSIDRFKNR